MLYGSFDGSYQFGVACAIDLMKGITHCLMSFTHGWVVNNHPGISDPELLCTPPPPLTFLLASPLSHSPSKGPDTRYFTEEVTEINWDCDLKRVFLFFLPLFTPRSSQIDYFACFALIIILGRCSVNVQRMNMNIRCHASSRDQFWKL